MSERKKLIAVYGTLRRGNGNYRHLLSEAEFLGEFDSPPVYNLYGLGCGFPKLKNGGTTSVKMEVFAVNDREAANVDSLEGYREGEVSTFYDKETIETPFGDAGVYVYVGQPEERFLIESGDWMNQNVKLKQDEMV